MLNFVLEKNKKNIIEEYFIRVFNIFLIFFLFSIILLITLLLPSVFYIKYENNIVSQQLLSIKDKVGNNNEDPIEIIKNTNFITKIIDSEIENYDFTGILEKVISLKNNNIKIHSFSIIKNSNNKIEIIIDGISKTRDSLTSFNKKLKESGLFEKVELPVSDLIKNIDSNFKITLIYK